MRLIPAYLEENGLGWQAVRATLNMTPDFTSRTFDIDCRGRKTSHYNLIFELFLFASWKVASTNNVKKRPETTTSSEPRNDCAVPGEP